MDRSEWVHILAKTDLARLCDLTDIIRKTLHVRITRPPRVGVLGPIAEAPEDHALSSLGEVLVTTAEVEIADARGYAIILGLDEERALLAAALDAALQSNAPCASLILEQLRLIRHGLAASQQTERAPEGAARTAG